MKERNLAIEFLKFLAIFLVFNSHLESVYPIPSLATGGSIGNALFFFVSGFTLFRGRMDRFDVWYSRRIRRIFIPVFSWAVIAYVIFDTNTSINNFILLKGIWFLQAIMVYYVILYFIKKYFIKKHKLLFAIYFSTILIWNYIDLSLGSSMNAVYSLGASKILQPYAMYFVFMLLGALIGDGIIIIKKSESLTKSLILLFVSVIVYYVYQYICRIHTLSHLFVLIVPLLMLIVLRFYDFAFLAIEKVKKINWRYTQLLSALCLEMYIVQTTIIHQFNFLPFPVNALVIILITYVLAYITKLFSNLVTQVISGKPFVLRELIKLF